MSEAEEAANGGETFGAARPVAVECVGACRPRDRTQHERNDDRVVGVTDDRYEVRHEVDGHEQVTEKRPQPPPNAPRQRRIGCEPAD